MLSVSPLIPDSAMLDGVREYLRLDYAHDDSGLDAILLAAINQAENCTGQILIQREARQMVSAGSDWQILSAFPVVSVQSVTGIPAEGARFALSPDAYVFEHGFDGTARLRVKQPGIAGRVEVVVIAGLAASWSALPEALRLGIHRIAAHSFEQRDGSGTLPESALALLKPWRRIRLK